MGIFFLAVVALYFVGCVYVGIRALKPFKSRTVRTVGIVIISLLSISFFGQRLVYQVIPEWLNQAIYVAGTLWLVVVLYASILFLLLDFARLVARLRGIRREHSKSTLIYVALLLMLIIGVGIHNATTPVVTRYHMKSQKVAPGDTLRLAIVSDLHMGYAVRENSVRKMVDLINAEHADMCIIAGDLIDGDVLPVVNNDLGRAIDSIDTRLGTVAVLGNHEYMGDVDQAIDYIRSLRLTFLCDSTERVENLQIVGRNDMSSIHRRQSGRMALEPFASDSTLNIVIDHQPGAIDESVNSGADLHISGHTHAVQVFPMRFFTKRIFDIDYGFCRVGQTHVIVTSGFGTWGPRMRLASISEIVVLEIIGY